MSHFKDIKFTLSVLWLLLMAAGIVYVGYLMWPVSAVILGMLTFIILTAAAATYIEESFD
jgi:hypothetical protein